MSELKRIVADMETVFAQSGYPADFLADYDQMECLASHPGRETFLVRRKDSGETAVASCYDRTAFPIRPDIRLLRELSHPGLPRYLEEYRNERMICVVREYIPGETLSVYARERQLTLRQIAAIGEELCDILHVLHTHEPPVIHRDLKPENVIIRPDGSAALIDFDISRAVKTEAQTDTFFFGTKGYAPPEQYGFGQTDARADIYALGVLLRWLVTGSARENRNVRIDERLQGVIDRCTAFSPEDRYADVLKVRDALRAVRTRPRRIRPAVAAALAAAAAALLLCGFAVGRWTDWLRPPERIAFAEPLVERAVRLQLGKARGALTPEELAGVRSLYIYGTEAFPDFDGYSRCTVDGSSPGSVRTLDDLRLLPGLESFFMGREGLVDVSALGELPQLRSVELKHMKVYSVEDLARDRRLEYAVLFDIGVSDFTPLENCPWLTTLDVGLNPVTDLRQLGTHPGVQSLGLMWLKLDSLEGLPARFPAVRTVSLQHSGSVDLTPLRELPRLETVYVLAEQAGAAEAALAGGGVTVQVTEN